MCEKEPYEFYVGQTVQVVSEPYRKCVFSWTPEMDKYCGVIAQIAEKRYNELHMTFVYNISADNGKWSWDGNCFIPVAETPDFDIADEEFYKLLLSH